MAPAPGGRPRYHPGSYAKPTAAQALEIVVGAILTQNTAWSNVERAIEALYLDGAMDERLLLRIPKARLHRLIRSSGYFRQKAVRLKSFLNRAADKGGIAAWLLSPLEALRVELLAVPGVGPETADSILLYAGAKPAFVVDAYTLRIGTRIGWFQNPLRVPSYEEARAFFMRVLPHSVKVYQEFHALIVALAKLFCRKQPLCGHCPLAEECTYALSIH